MYINDIHILFFILVSICGIISARLVEWTNDRLPKYEKVLTVEYFDRRKKINKETIFLIIANVFLNITILYRYGINSTFIGNLELIKYLILAPMLLSVFCIDYKHKIIPNRLVLTIFEIGIITAFLYGISNVAITINMLVGMIIGGSIFLTITLLGSAIYGKETIGMGDVKLIAALGLYFGLSNIITISLMSFLIYAIVGIILIFARKKKINDYMVFGPFIVISCIISILIPSNIILKILTTIFTFGRL